MPAAKTRVVVKRAAFDPAAIAKALHVPEAVAVAKLRDGRVVAQWAEVWGARLYAYVVHGHANVAASDGAVLAQELGDLGVSVKSLTARGVKFQQSIFVGKNRPCSQEDLANSIARVDRYVVVDIRAFPQVDFVVLPSTWLLQETHAGRLQPGGWSASAFYREIERLGPLVLEEIDLEVLDGA